MSPTSVYMPDVKVEVAFNATFTTPAASRTWTDISTYVELEEQIGVSGGRSDARGTIEANTLSLTLDNSDGRFTPFLATSPYYPNVKLGRPIRVTAKPVGSAVTSTRFLGYVDSWPTEWSEGVAEYAVARISAASRLARLGRGTLLKSGAEVEVETLAVGPRHYWTLGDPAGSTAATDSAGGTETVALTPRRSWTPAVVFGTGVGIASDGLTAATFGAGGQYLRGDTTVTGDLTLSAFYATSDATTAGIIGVGDFSIQLNSSGKLLVAASSTTTATDPGTAVNDGNVHHVALRVTVATGLAECVRDGVVVASATAATSVNDGRVYVGNITEGVSDLTLTGTVCHVALLDYLVTNASLVEIAGAANGWLGEQADARFTRYARWGGALVGDISADATAVIPMQAIDSTDQTVATMMRKVESTEGGVLFDSRDGILTLLSHSDRFNKTATVTLATSGIEAGVAPRLDDSELFNRAIATVTDSATVTATNQTSIDAYGLYDIPFEILSTNLAAAEGRCWWTVNQYGEPAIRVPNLSVDVLPLALATQDLLATVDIGDRVATSGAWPGQIGTALASGFLVEGYTETFGPETWLLGLNVSPADLWEVWSLDSATRSQLDSTTTLGY